MNYQFTLLFFTAYLQTVTICYMLKTLRLLKYKEKIIRGLAKPVREGGEYEAENDF